MVLIAMVLGVLWLAAVIIVVGLCVSATRGDAQLRARLESNAERTKIRLIA